jgi:transposase
MNATTVAVDLAKSVFEIAVADQNWRVTERPRLSRPQFERWFHNRSVGLVVMEACGSAHFWARRLKGMGIEVKLLPPKYVRAYVKRNKTDAADAAALSEAVRCADIVPVRMKSVEQQSLQSLHRIRSSWMATRTSRINGLRGFCWEFGICIAAGSRLGVEQISRVLVDATSAVPAMLRDTLKLLIDEIRLLEARIAQLERELTTLAKASAPCETLLSIPGIGLLTATAMVAATGGDVTHFKDARHFASWFGLTPKEHSSGKLGRSVMLVNGVVQVINALTADSNGISDHRRHLSRLLTTKRAGKRAQLCLVERPRLLETHGGLDPFAINSVIRALGGNLGHVD